MKKLNKYFSVSGGSDYTLESETRLVIRRGYAEVFQGGRAVVRDDGYADVRSGGSAYVQDGGRAVVRDDGYADVRSGGSAYVQAGGHADVQAGGSAHVWDGGHADVQAGGSAHVQAGGHAYAWGGGHAVVHGGGSANVWEGGLKTTAGEIPHNLVSDEWYTLRTCQGMFQAGCTPWLTREQALARWDREDDRACLFTLAILSCDWGK